MDLELLKSNLSANGMELSCFETAAQAGEYLSREIDGTTVGIGGSVTVREIGLYEQLKTHNRVYWHWMEEGNAIPAEACCSEVYITSANAISETGEIVNIDGSGNRVGSILYGHKRVYFVVGVNKIVPDYDSAVWRARNIAAPLNARRLKLKTPCAARADRCYDCSSPDRICNGLSVLWKKMTNTDHMEIVLIEEKLGF